MQHYNRNMICINRLYSAHRPAPYVNLQTPTIMKDAKCKIDYKVNRLTALDIFRGLHNYLSAYNLLGILFL
jgi:hypothetical protein